MPSDLKNLSVHPFLLAYPMTRVVRAYPSGLIRLYCIIRSHILRNHILAEIGQYIPFSGNVVELGCGFGLFSNCFAMTHPDCTFYGVDKNAQRIERARRAAEICGAGNVHYICGDARSAFRELPPQDCVYMLDLVHHLPPESVPAFLQDCWDMLRPGGMLVVKDVADRPWHKMAFTWLLDVLMTRGELPHYLPPARFLHLLEGLGADVLVHRINDYLPYPHMLYLCRKPEAS